MTTNKTQHTPNPWVVTVEENEGNCKIYSIENKGGAESGDEAEANRKLIEAAPDLLDALKTFVAIYHEGTNQAININPAWDKAYAALAKAQGK